MDKTQKVDKIPKVNKTFLFDIACVSYVIWECLYHVGVHANLILGVNYYYIGFFSVLFSILCIRSRFQFTIFRSFLLLTIIGLACYFKIEYQYNRVFVLSFLIFASYNIPITRIVKIFYYSTIFSTLTICSLSFLNILPDVIYNHDMSGSSISDAHTFGFDYYSYPAYYGMVVALLDLYIHRNNYSLLRFACVLLFMVFVFSITTTRLQIIVSIAYLTLFILCKYNLISFQASFWKYVGLSCYPLAFLLYFLLGASSLIAPDILDLWDELFNKRMEQTIIGFTLYPVTWLGNCIEMIGTTEAVGNNYFYIDAGYAYWILAYGIIYTLFIIASYTVVCYKAYIYKNTYVFCWLLIFSGVNMINDFFTSSCFNPVVLFLFADFSPINEEPSFYKKLKSEKA